MRFYTAEEIADMTGKSARWVKDNLLSTGKLPAFRLGISWRVRSSDFDEFLEAMVREAREPELVPVPPYPCVRKRKKAVV